MAVIYKFYSLLNGVSGDLEVNYFKKFSPLSRNHGAASRVTKTCLSHFKPTRE